MGLKQTWEKVQEPVTGFAGAGTGLVAGELTGEFAARVSGKTGYDKAAIKTVVKGLLGILMFATGNAMGGIWAVFWKTFAYSNWGSTILDWIFAAYPGGIFGIAERLAVTVRTWGMGAETVAAELATLEKAGVITTPQPPDGNKITTYA